MNEINWAKGPWENLGVLSPRLGLLTALYYCLKGQRGGEGEGVGTIGECWATCMTSPVSPNSLPGQYSFPHFTDQEIESEEETVIWPRPHSCKGQSLDLSLPLDGWWTVRHFDRLQKILHSP